MAARRLRERTRQVAAFQAGGAELFVIGLRAGEHRAEP